MEKKGGLIFEGGVLAGHYGICIIQHNVNVVILLTRSASRALILCSVLISEKLGVDCALFRIKVLLKIIV